ncbi:MAG: hypothetical protein LBU77_04080 [Clostridiales bacterium]|nr:hypothetical protein [Clostridiales bacterium]
MSALIRQTILTARGLGVRRTLIRFNRFICWADGTLKSVKALSLFNV